MAEKRKNITAKEFEAKFDAGEDVDEYLDYEAAIRRITLDLPVWMTKALDREAKRMGVSRQAVIKTWLTERLDNLKVSRKKHAAG